MREGWEPGPTVVGDGGVALATWDLGGDGPPLLLTHGTGFNAGTMAAVADTLRPCRRLWALDLRGHGRSGHAPGRDYRDWDPMARDILAVVDTLAPDGGIAGAGHSLGGAVMLRAEQLRPGTFAALWCYEPPITPPPAPGEPPPEEPDMSSIVLRRRAVFPSRAEALANYAGKRPFNRFRPDVLAAFVELGFVDLPDGTVRLACEPEEESTIYAGAPIARVWAGLGAVAPPTTIAYGDDPTSSSKWSPAIVDCLPNGRGERYPGLNHMGPMEAPDLIGADIAASLGC